MLSQLFRTTVQTILNDFREDGLSYLDYLDSGVTRGDEAMVRQKIVEPLLVGLGYTLAQEVSPEVRSDGGAADIVVRIKPDNSADEATLNGHATIPAMVWELKKTSDRHLASHEGQLRGYVLAHRVRYGVLTNGHELHIYERVGTEILLMFAFSLRPFAELPSSTDKKGTEAESFAALDSFYDLLYRESFLNTERLKQQIILKPYHVLKLSPTDPLNEAQLTSELKTEIQHATRLVRLRFRTQLQQAAEFEQALETRQTELLTARHAFLDWVREFQQTLRLPPTTDDLARLLDEVSQFWGRTNEAEFTEQAMTVSGLKPHLKKVVNRMTFENRARTFYQTLRDVRSWEHNQRKKLEHALPLAANYHYWQESMNLLIDEPEREFCLQTVYIFVTRLLLIRICEDKGIISEKISDGGYENYLNFSQRFYDYFGHANRRLLAMAFEDTGYIYGHFFSRDVFDWYQWEEETIVRFLWRLNPYNFADVRADLIGLIYEQYVDEGERKRKGQFYTPAEVVETVLDAAEYRGASIVGKRLLDPSCGSGRFLVEAARRLIPHLVAQAEARHETVDYLHLINHGLRHCLYGLDVNRFACFLAEVNLVVQALDLLKDKGVQKDVILQRFHIYPTNSLLREEEIVNSRPTSTLFLQVDSSLEDYRVSELIKTRRNHHGELPDLQFEQGFDFVVGNPPYVRADHPDLRRLRQLIEETGRYPSLHKKWDLFIPFVDFALEMLKEEGRHAFIVSDAFQTEEYARQARARLLTETTLEQLIFAPGLYFFENAAVYAVIYGLRKTPPSDKHLVQRRQILALPLDDPHHQRNLPALSQHKWQEQIFRPEFEGENGLNFDDCPLLGEICYISKGMVLHSKETLDPIINGKREKLFVKDDLLSEFQDNLHSKKYVEGDGIRPYVLTKILWLEWSERVPDMLSRPCFPELFESPKIMMSLSGNAYYDRKGEYYNQANSISDCVPYHTLDTDSTRRHVAKLMARQISQDEIDTLGLTPGRLERTSKTILAEMLIRQRSKESATYKLGYLTALLNCRWLRSYMMTFVRRGSRQRFYPDDLKQWPIAKADEAMQAKIEQAVLSIMSSKEIVGSVDPSGFKNPKGLEADFKNLTGLDATLAQPLPFVRYKFQGRLSGRLKREGQRLIVRQSPLSYIESEHDIVLDYLAHYLQTHQETLRYKSAEELPALIPIPRTVEQIETIMTQLAHKEHERLILAVDAAQQEAWLDEIAFELYGVDEANRQKLAGQLVTVPQVPDWAEYVSLLSQAGESPLLRVAFRLDEIWVIRTMEELPNPTLLWLSDGERVSEEAWVVLEAM